MPPSARKGSGRIYSVADLPDPAQLRSREDGCAPHPRLAIHAGCACALCNYKTTSLELMGRHFSEEHSVGKTASKWPRDMIRTDMSLLSWTSNGAWQGFWIVVSNEQATAGPTWNCSPDRVRTLNALHKQERERIARDDGAHSATDVADEDPALKSNWMRRTRWVETYKGLDRKVLWGLTVPPNSTGRPLIIGHDGAAEVVSSAEDERKLVSIDRAVSRFLSRYRLEQLAGRTPLGIDLSAEQRQIILSHMAISERCKLEVPVCLNTNGAFPTPEAICPEKTPFGATHPPNSLVTLGRYSEGCYG